MCVNGCLSCITKNGIIKWEQRIFIEATTILTTTEELIVYEIFRDDEKIFILKSYMSYRNKRLNVRFSRKQLKRRQNKIL